MRCNKHFRVDSSSNVGVCASCLRERLLVLTDAPSWAHQLPEPRRSSDPMHQMQIPHPSPLVFPRSVSPYISRRKSAASEEFRFFSTPQVGPAAGTVKKKTKSKFHAISDLFRSKSAKAVKFPSDPFVYPSAGDRNLGNRRGKCSNRGMSPEAVDDSDAESLSPRGYSPERRKMTPNSGQSRAKASPARSQVVKSGIGICLSPLMRPSSSRQWNGNSKSVGPAGGMEGVYSGEVRSTVRPHLSTAASFCSNRSRKLADFGKFDRHR